MQVWPDILLVCLGGVLTLRLVIWQFFRASEPIFRENFSDITVAFLIILLAVIWLAIKLIDRLPLKKSGYELPVFLLFAAAVGSLFYTPDLATSFKGVLVLGAEITFFYMLQDLLDTPSRLRSFLIFLLGLAFVVSIYGIFTFFMFWAYRPSTEDLGLLQTDRSLFYLLAHHRAVSFLGWPNVLSGYLLLFLPLLIILPFHLKEMGQKIAAVIVLFSAAVCFLYTLSFLSWFSFLISTCVLSPILWKILSINTWPKEKKRMLFYAFGAFLILFLLIIFHKNFLMSLTPRIFYYKAAFILLGHNFLWGYGWDSFAILCRRMTDDTNNLSAYVHNSYLQIWLEAGIIGFLGILLLVVRFFRQSFSIVIPAKAGIQNNWILIGISWGLLAFFIDNLFNFTLLKPNIALFWWTMLAIKSRDRHYFISNKVVSVPTFSMAILILMFVFLARIWGGYLLYYKAMNIKKPGSYNISLKMLDEAKALDPWNSYLPAGAGSIRMEQYANSRNRLYLEQAAFNYLQAVYRSPNVYYNYFVLSKIFDALGDPSRAEIFTLKAKALSPAEFNLDNMMFHKSDPQK
jgi:O-antigen ligase